jgi:hypothetical protein
MVGPTITKGHTVTRRPVTDLLPASVTPQSHRPFLPWRFDVAYDRHAVGGAGGDRGPSLWSRYSGSITGTLWVRSGVDGGQLGKGAFIGFQPLDKGLRAFFILRQGKQRIPLATVEHRPGFLPPLFETIAWTGIGRR